MTATDTNVTVRFWDKVDKNGPLVPGMTLQCWIWTGARDAKGYPRFKLNSRAMYATRARLLIEGEGIKPGEFVAKLCRNRPCVRPEHHAVGPRADAIACSTRGHIDPVTISLIALSHRDGLLPVAQIAQCCLVGKRLALAIVAESYPGEAAGREFRQMAATHFQRLHLNDEHPHDGCGPNGVRNGAPAAA